MGDGCEVGDCEDICCEEEGEESDAENELDEQDAESDHEGFGAEGALGSTVACGGRHGCGCWCDLSVNVQTIFLLMVVEEEEEEICRWKGVGESCLRLS